MTRHRIPRHVRINWYEWGHCHRCGVNRGTACIDMRYNAGPVTFYLKRPHALRFPYLDGVDT